MSSCPEHCRAWQKLLLLMFHSHGASMQCSHCALRPLAPICRGSHGQPRTGCLGNHIHQGFPPPHKASNTEPQYMQSVSTDKGSSISFLATNRSLLLAHCVGHNPAMLPDLVHAILLLAQKQGLPLFFQKVSSASAHVGAQCYVHLCKHNQGPCHAVFGLPTSLV